MLKKAFVLTALLAAVTVQGAAPQQVARAGAAAADTNKTVRVMRAPVRRLEDPHSSFSAVALDVARDEIVLSDENLAQILVYNRLDNTPPQAALTEPKRVIGGPLTKINLNCGTYVDPFSGETTDDLVQRATHRLQLVLDSMQEQHSVRYMLRASAATIVATLLYVGLIWSAGRIKIWLWTMIGHWRKAGRRGAGPVTAPDAEDGAGGGREQLALRIDSRR